ncbi:hypothetical protein NP439_13435 [Oceanobacillus jeddahense]|uniref:ArsR family transcriptional regulator n=1 Tax=Oceanobacillus jeddahense TaxID=1462527 RepID=A0ABY5JZA4_9BACI|nr:hypothetical protein [Oceanobacillus jeddahense]UUI05565.1 hypothetical protein NP439_13435 [Oceanobacillus jeddahense]
MTRAANFLYVTQPILLRQLKDLEELGKIICLKKPSYCSYR